MTSPSVIVVVVDGWSPGHLETYGSGLARSPVLNAIASRGVLFEHALVDSDSQFEVYQSLLSGTHFLERKLRSNLATKTPAAGLLEASGLEPFLLADGQGAELEPVWSQFSQVELFDEPLPRQRANSIEETRMARFGQFASDWLTSHPDPGLFWIHQGSFRQVWDAPMGLREALLDEEDPDPPAFLYPSESCFEFEHDPDLLLANQAAYGAQVAVWDSSLEFIWDTYLQRSQHHPTLLVILGSSGFGLGEHSAQLVRKHRLRTEFVHIPLLTIDSRQLNQPWRSAILLQPHRVKDIVMSYLRPHGLAAENPHDFSWIRQTDPLLSCTPSPLGVLASQGHWGVRTPQWYATFPLHSAVDGALSQFRLPEDLEGVELYAKPDDRWEDNELSHRCPEVVHDHAQRGLEQLQSWARSDSSESPLGGRTSPGS